MPEDDSSGGGRGDRPKAPADAGHDREARQPDKPAGGGQGRANGLAGGGASEGPGDHGPRSEPPRDRGPEEREEPEEPEGAVAEGERWIRRKAGRNLPVAITVGLALGGMVLLSLYTVKEIFLAVMVAFLAIGLRELTQAFGTRGIRAPLLPLAFGLAATVTFAYVFGAGGLVASVAITTLAVLVWRMPSGADGYVRDSTAALFSIAYLVLIGGVVALLMSPQDGDDRIVIFVAVTVASDIGGYFAGSYLGRHKLAPTISPKKTWEGFAGSTLTCMAIGAWLVPWLLDGGKIWEGALLGAAVVVVATVGDLIESMIKRDLGVKDLGDLLPGHGGVMDRLDSLLAAAPVVWLLLEAFAPVR